jgi:alkylation response protein AidB-like acyl-CoA dehydrogenase
MAEAVHGRLTGYLERIDRLAPLVREHADRTEREAQLAPPVVEALHDAGLFRILLPARLGGGELTVPESLRVIEAMARLDASAGWNLAICSGGPVFGHYVAKDAFEQIFADPRAVVAGTLNPMTTQATRSDGGWRFTGRATYVSGSAQATWMNAAALVLHDGSPQLVDGVPVMRTALFPMKQCRILDTWKTTGMRGTGSNDCVFENVLVPDDFTYEWPNPRSPWQRGAFAGMPVTTQLGGGLASVALGAARHAIDTLMDLAGVKVPAGTRATMRERPLTQMQLGQAEGWLQAGRAYLFQATEDAWRMGEAGVPFDAAARAAARLASVTAAKLAAMAVDLVHEASGMNAMQTTCDIERCWRDVHTITQHIILGASRYEVVGRIMLGLDPGSPII